VLEQTAGLADHLAELNALAAGRLEGAQQLIAAQIMVLLRLGIVGSFVSAGGAITRGPWIGR
jgi:hypothetical protein